MLKSSSLKLTTLSENSAATGGVCAEWGLSIFVEAGSRKILLDTGASAAVVQNAHHLGIDIRSVDTIVLSHGHGDHTGGLPAVLSSVDGQVPVIAHPDVWDLKYSRNTKTGTHRFVGIPHRVEYLESLGADFELTEVPHWITDDIATSGSVPMTSRFESVADNLVRSIDDDFTQDPMHDDLSLFIRTDLGLVIVLGCAHRGMINIITHARDVMDTEEVYMVVGGTHLISASKERLSATVETLRDLGVTWLGVSHCTGFHAAARLEYEFPERFFTNYAGTSITFPFQPRKR